MSNGIKLESDKTMSPELQTEVQELRGLMVGQINKEVSDRFTLEYSATSPSAKIKDNVLGVESDYVPMFAISEVLEALNSMYK